MAKTSFWEVFLFSQEKVRFLSIPRFGKRPKGKVEMPLAEAFWGGYFGGLLARLGVRWMFNCASKQ